MLENLVSKSRTDPTIVDAVSTSTERILTALNAALIDGNGVASPDLYALIDKALSFECCNLFIVKDTSFDGNKNCFTISKSKALKHKSGEPFDVFDERIKQFPSLFITANGDYKRCKNPDQKFYYGMVTGVSEQGKNIEICFRKLFNKPMPQQRLNEIAVEIGINTNDGVDLLDDTNWLIKRMDIRKLLTDRGVNYV